MPSVGWTRTQLLIYGGFLYVPSIPSFLRAYYVARRDRMRSCNSTSRERCMLALIFARGRQYENRAAKETCMLVWRWRLCPGISAGNR